MLMSIVTMKSILKYAIIVIALLLVGVLSIGAIGNVCAQIYQPISQSGGGVRIAQPVAQGGFVGSSVVSAPFVSSGVVPGYTCYQNIPGGPFTCYPGSGGIYASNGVYSTGGTFISRGGGLIQPVQQFGAGTQVAAPVAVI
jgi:hypothetical protein